MRSKGFKVVVISLVLVFLVTFTTAEKLNPDLPKGFVGEDDAGDPPEEYTSEAYEDLVDCDEEKWNFKRISAVAEEISVLNSAKFDVFAD